MNFINAIRTYFLECPLLTSGTALGVDFLSEGSSYSLDAEPCDPIKKRYADGGTLRQFQFSFNSREKYGTLTSENISNQAFVTNLTEWVEGQTCIGNLPDLGEILKPTDITVLSNGFITEQGDDTARYVIQFCLTYYQPWRYTYGNSN